MSAGLRSDNDRLAQRTVRYEITIVAAEVGVELDQGARQNIVVFVDLLKVLLPDELVDRRVNVVDHRKFYVLVQHGLHNFLRLKTAVFGDHRL